MKYKIPMRKLPPSGVLTTIILVLAAVLSQKAPVNAQKQMPTRPIFDARERMKQLLQVRGNLPQGTAPVDVSKSSAIESILTGLTGSLDPSFNLTGTRREVFTNGEDDCLAMDIQTDGKIVCAGNSVIDGDNDTAVARFNDDGSPDMTFGKNGKVSVTVSLEYDTAYAVKVEPDGKIITAGFMFGKSDSIVVLRFNPDGTLDNTFGLGGRVFRNGGDALAIDVQTDGKILITGSIPAGAIRVLRLNSNGSTDSTFGTQGIATAIMSGSDFAWGLDVAVQQDGKIVIGGVDELSGHDSVMAIARFNVNGMSDTSFGNAGLVQIPVSDNSYASDVVVQQDGKIVVGGLSYDSTDQSEVAALVRVNASGSLDSTFGGNGKIRTSFPPNLRGLGLQNDGKLLAIGGYRIERFNPDGSLDLAFASGGVLTLSTAIDGHQVKVAPDGRIVAGGTLQGNNWDFWAGRFLSGGAADNSFNDSGSASIDIANEFTAATAVVAQPDGKIIAAGSATNGSDDDFTVFRYNVNGTRDNSFGDDGRVQTDFGNGSNESVAAAALQPDGKILVAGTSAGFGALVRYDSTGTPDPAFGSGGRVLVTIDPNGSFISSLLLQPDGKILVAGSSNNTLGFLVARYNSNGTPDAAFGSAGAVTTFFPGNDYAGASSVMLQPDGKIVLAGSAYHPDDFDEFYIPNFSLARYNTDGSPDLTFGSGGRVVTSTSEYNLCSSAVLLPNGKFLVAGTSYRNGSSLVRYNSNGSLDSSFDGDGQLILPMGAGDNGVNAIRLDQNDRLIVAGYVYSNVGVDFAVARLNADGSFDAEFNGNGKLAFDFANGKPDYASSIAIDREGRIIVGGSGAGSFAVARLSSGSRLRSKARADFDGDGRTDLAVFRPSEGNWYLDNSTSGFSVLNWGVVGDHLAPADYDGDGKTDIAVFRPSDDRSPDFYILNSSTNTFTFFNWGEPGDEAVPGDFDADGKADLAVCRPSTNTWYFRNSAGMTVSRFGNDGDLPVPGDYDGDGRTDIAVYRPSNGEWLIRRTDGTVEDTTWGTAGDIPVVADYDGDQVDDLAVYRPSEGRWYIRGSRAGIYNVNWGDSGDIPVPGDYDGDGRTDPGVYRRGKWYLLQSTKGIEIRQFGLPDDKPVPAAYLP